MVTIKYKHATGNCMLQYAAGYVLAKKYDLHLATRGVSANSHIKNNLIDFEQYFNLDRPINDKKFNSLEKVQLGDFLKYLNGEKQINSNLELNDYFQKKELVYEYRDLIKGMFKDLKYSPSAKNEVFVHYRLGDVYMKRMMVPVEYYNETLEKINCSGGYIASDSPDHPWINELCKKFNLKKYKNTDNPLDVIDYAKNFENLVVGEGTFGWWMAFLSQGSKIYYNKKKWKWGGNTLWEFPEWNFAGWDWDISCVGTENNLTDCKPIKVY